MDLFLSSQQSYEVGVTVPIYRKENRRSDMVRILSLMLPYRQIGGWPSSPTRIKEGVGIQRREGNLARN